MSKSRPRFTSLSKATPSPPQVTKIRLGVALGLLWVGAALVSACGSGVVSGGAGGRPPSSGGSPATGGATPGTGGAATGGKDGTGGSVATGGKATGGGAATGGATGGGNATGGGTPTGGAAHTGGAAGGENGYLVSMLQATKARAEDLTQEDIRTLVTDAVAQAGGLGFIKDGDTVVLKPNLLTNAKDQSGGLLAPEVNGVTTDWRLTRAVAELVRARNPTGKILVMEGSVVPTKQAFETLGYTKANFGTNVDELIAIEGSSCIDKSTTALVQKKAVGGSMYWMNRRYVEANVLISLPVMKTHMSAGITGGIKNLGIGATPAGQYANGTNANDCTRGQKAPYIDHARAPLADFVHDFYSARPADFVVMDGLQAVQHGPHPMWGGGTYETDRMNMRLVLAGRNAVALDTVATLVMRCDPKEIGYLTKLETSGLGTTDIAKIKLVGKAIADVSKAFAGPSWACPGS